ncbi:MAG: hypothetical protein ACJ74E_01425 [Actinomycetes bacterium]
MVVARPQRHEAIGLSYADVVVAGARVQLTEPGQDDAVVARPEIDLAGVRVGAGDQVISGTSTNDVVIAQAADVVIPAQ